MSAMGARQNILNVKSHQRTTNEKNKAIADTKTPLMRTCCAVGHCPSNGTRKQVTEKRTVRKESPSCQLNVDGGIVFADEVGLEGLSVVGVLEA